MPDPSKRPRSSPKDVVQAPARHPVVPARLRCVVEARGPSAVWLQVSGELDLAEVPRLDGAVEHDSSGARLVVLDLSGLTFIDLAGVRSIVEARVRAARQERRLVLASPPPCVVRLVAFCGLAEEVEVLPRGSAGDVPRASVRPPSPRDVPPSPVAARRRRTSRTAEAVVTSVGSQEVLLAGDDGPHAALPAPRTFGVEPGGRVKLYTAADGRLDGWMPVGGDFGVNLRHWRSQRTYRPALAECFGHCGVIWEAPAAEELADHGEGCLECTGSLEVRPEP